mgnify:FL=1
MPDGKAKSGTGELHISSFRLCTNLRPFPFLRAAGVGYEMLRLADPEKIESLLL